MSLSNMLNQFIGMASGTSTSRSSSKPAGGLSSLASSIPGGLAGGATAGGVMALLAGNKKARKFASKAAVYGGAAVLGGLAYNAYRNWQQNQSQQGHHQQPSATDANRQQFAEVITDEFQVTLVKAMISAAKADGHIDQKEQERIYQAIERMQLTPEMKAVLFDLMHQPATLGELAGGANSMEQRTELYIASCLAIDIDHQAERDYLERLALVLEIPRDLAKHLQSEAQHALADAA